jgi:hypothetical protein
MRNMSKDIKYVMIIKEGKEMKKGDIYWSHAYGSFKKLRHISLVAPHTKYLVKCSQ